MTEVMLVTRKKVMPVVSIATFIGQPIVNNVKKTRLKPMIGM